MNMQHEETKCIQHKIQHTVAQWGRGSREKRPGGQKSKKGGG